MFSVSNTYDSLQGNKTHSLKFDKFNSWFNSDTIKLASLLFTINEWRIDMNVNTLA